MRYPPVLRRLLCRLAVCPTHYLSPLCCLPPELFDSAEQCLLTSPPRLMLFERRTLLDLMKAFSGLAMIPLPQLRTVFWAFLPLYLSRGFFELAVI